ncbi:SDR family oxidoreductase [Pigmentiphaga soli]|uniref:SDR family oxidoreductase n=1 Tax=Pigmentiphaga soli TaxID=1007095 RepID=A0ABP8HTY8_9BURK
MKGKTALITGSSGGLGYAVAEGLAGAGCNIVLHGLEPAADMESQRSELERRHGVKALYLQADLADPAAIESMIGQARDGLGPVDILVNNAVVRNFGRVEEFPVDAWNMALAVNLSAAFHAIRLTLPGMRQRGWGRIFNMTSVYGFRATPNRIDYVTTKTALIGMTRAVALENVTGGITCNAICPGAVYTPGSEVRVERMMAEQNIDRDTAMRRFMVGKQPSGRFVEPQDVAAMVVFLCGPASRDITGAVLPVEGGWLAS